MPADITMRDATILVCSSSSVLAGFRPKGRALLRPKFELLVPSGSREIAKLKTICQNQPHNNKTPLCSLYIIFKNSVALCAGPVPFL